MIRFFGWMLLPVSIGLALFAWFFVVPEMKIPGVLLMLCAAAFAGLGGWMSKS